ncbi:MAG TPA: DUF6655 family protein [Pirellulales bacterium]|jgi:hypothetical protein|nr:DUF6655 family protein [Pirellulales bacterium]
MYAGAGMLVGRHDLALRSTTMGGYNRRPLLALAHLVVRRFMMRSGCLRFSAPFVAMVGLVILLAGCGTTRMSDTMRTGTEQLLISNAVDRAINEMDFSILNGKDLFLDTQYMKGAVDEGYIISSLRQQLLASGCIMKKTREEATYIVEARAGAVGTDRHDVLLGIPAVNLPGTGMPGMPSQIPEIPFAKSTQQKGVTKLAVFVYDQHLGIPTWQSGAITVAATSRDTWLLGTGPFQRGTIYDRTGFAGSRLLLPFTRDKTPPAHHVPVVPVTAQASFDISTRYAMRSRAAAANPSRSATAASDNAFAPLSLTPSGSAVVTVGGIDTKAPAAPSASSAGGGGNASSNASTVSSASGTPTWAPTATTQSQATTSGPTSASGGNGAGALIMGAAPWIQENAPLTIPGVKR